MVLVSVVLAVVALGCTTPRYRYDRLKETDGVELRDLEDLIADGTRVTTAGLGLRATKLEYDFKNERDEYRLGKNDVLRIQILGHPEMSSQAPTAELSGNVVEKDGNVHIPVVGPLRAEGLTIGEFRVKLRETLARFVLRPDVAVDIARFESQKFYVLGQVLRPGVLPVDGDTTLLEALSLAGGVAPTGNLESAYVLRGGKLLPINLADILVRGDISRNPYMRHGDVVYVPDNADQKVYVLGEVMQPKVVPIERNRITLAEALAAAGGPTPALARREMAILRGGYARPIVYTIDLEKALLYDQQILLKPGDRVVLAPTGFAMSSRYAAQLYPFLRGVAAVAIVANVAGQAAALTQ